MHLALNLARDLFNLACLAALFHVGRLVERERWTETREQPGATDHPKD
ncbi:hypothetical protein [Streptomyces sp. RKAG337]|nr:hypothetical protein [Streptomyces sp. RKAG337]MCM2427366.1 hypothetical protein [Streptomyces sp. RKAG337]